MPVDVTTEVEIGRPAADVYRFAADPMTAPDWYDNIERAEWRSAPALAVGSRASFTARFLGRRLEYVYEIVDLVPNERLVMRTADGPFPMETTYEWHRVEERLTRMKLRNRGEPSGFSMLLSPLMAPAMRRANRNDLAKLKGLLESERR